MANIKEDLNSLLDSLDSQIASIDLEFAKVKDVCYSLEDAELLYMVRIFSNIKPNLLGLIAKKSGVSLSLLSRILNFKIKATPKQLKLLENFMREALN